MQAYKPSVDIEKLKINDEQNTDEVEKRLDDIEISQQNEANTGNGKQQDDVSVKDSQEKNRIEDNHQKPINENNPDQDIHEIDQNDIAESKQAEENTILEKADMDEETIEAEPYKPPSMIQILAESNVEIERIEMEQEDHLSRQYENFIRHQSKQKQKDAFVPLIQLITDTSHILNVGVCQNLEIQDPQKESFTKYMANMRPIDLSKTRHRVLWSKEKVARELLEQKEKAKREKKKKFIKLMGEFDKHL